MALFKPLQCVLLIWDSTKKGQSSVDNVGNTLEFIFHVVRLVDKNINFVTEKNMWKIICEKNMWNVKIICEKKYVKKKNSGKNL